MSEPNGMGVPYPILEYDAVREAFIEPSRIIQPVADMPEHTVFCFFQDVIRRVCENAPVIVTLGSEMGPNPVYVIETQGKRIAVTHPGIGGPFAAAFLDEMIAYGSRRFMACGGAGGLDKAVLVGHVVIPVSAIRDEGTSYHYLPPSREVTMHPQALQAIEQTLLKHEIRHIKGKTWTTDAIYRETPQRIARRRAEGCVTVEMEAATFFAVAEFRGVPFGHLLYGGDDLSGETWDNRDWIHGQASTREKLFWLAVEAVTRL